MTAPELTTFLGWTVVLHVGVLSASLVALTVFRDTVLAVHSGLLDLPAAELNALYVRYLAAYKAAVLVFSLVPWVSLKLMGY